MTRAIGEALEEAAKATRKATRALKAIEGKGPKMTAKDLEAAQSEAARQMAAKRRTFGAGPGRPRKVTHEKGAAYCLCVECRKKRGQYPKVSHRNPVAV